MNQPATITLVVFTVGYCKDCKARWQGSAALVAAQVVGPTLIGPYEAACIGKVHKEVRLIVQ